jgi:hypothetical protein
VPGLGLGLGLADVHPEILEIDAFFAIDDLQGRLSNTVCVKVKNQNSRPSNAQMLKCSNAL